MRNLSILLILLLSCCTTVQKKDLEPNQLNAVPSETLNWYQDARFGMFIHWGLYSVTGKQEWFRYGRKVPDEEYRALANQFNPTEFNADTWVQAAKSSGMKWITITTKHHDGFAIYSSPADSFDIDATPFGKAGRDPLDELVEACRRHDMKFGFYYSHYQDWDHPQGGVVNLSYEEKINLPFKKYMDEKALPQMRELLTKYSDVSVIWFDTPLHISDEEAHEFRALVKELAPGALIGGRLDDATGDFWSMPDNRVPQNPFNEPWETCMTSNGGWGWRIPMQETRPAKEMIQELSTIVSRGGNFLLNTGPSPTGKMNENDLAAFAQVGAWLTINGEAIYGTSENPFYGSPYICTTKDNKLFVHLFDWTKDSLNINRLQSEVKKVWLLADPTKTLLDFEEKKDCLTVVLPKNLPDSINSIVVIETQGKPEVKNFLPTEDDKGVITISSKEMNIIDNRFSSFTEHDSILKVYDTRRAWVNGSFEVASPGTFELFAHQTKSDTVQNTSYWIKINDNKLTVPVVDSLEKDKFIKQSIGKIKFDKAGIYNYTIRPTDWYWKTKQVFVKIKTLELIKD
ncbi:alpha-L-fucosidase [Flagellimonas sp. CMM7]|uniref:alpha-L-fucosidase n=1 Tax=Flagellimonas sp. CMM7 TaxID=2654676 RepID=UPI0013D4B3E7|nr:alpha-L-fucosidase [Flagellimonas sp. CMM7]UII78746.1 alpha-L-fucosidase [Flagellimonas sp. CMM7]